MNIIEEKISKICEENALEKGFFLIDINFSGQKGTKIIEVFIDSEEIVTIANCASLSRSINERIEQANFLQSSYRLDVSTPGVDRPLKFLKQYKKHIGRKFEIAFSDDNSTIRTETGSLLRIEDDYLFFNINKDELKIQFSNINKAQVAISFS